MSFRQLAMRFLSPAVWLMLICHGGATQSNAAEGSLGILGRDVATSDVDRLGLEEPRGVLVEALLMESPKQSSLQLEDVILRVQETEISDFIDLVRSLRGRQAGDAVEIMLFRDGQSNIAEVTLGVFPDDVGERMVGLANQDIAWAKRAAANLLIQGVPTPLDLEVAYQWLLAGAMDGDLTSMHNVALCLQSGYGTEQDFQASAEWLRHAAEQGYTPSMYSLSLMYVNGQLGEPDLKAAFGWSQKAAELNDVSGLNYLGWAYETALGVRTNKRQAAEYYRRAADRGFAVSQTNLGRLLLFGQGVTADAEAAHRWFLKSAEQGDVEGQAWLGYCCHNGVAMETDFEKARQWYELAAQQGSLMAQYNLGIMMLYGQGQEVDRQAALETFRAIAKQGSVDSLAMIGIMYENGWALPRRGYSAIKFYLKAEQAGSDLARQRLQALGVRPTPNTTPIATP